MANDPTADEMREYLTAQGYIGEDYEFPREEAIYWFASDYHGGQFSNLYSALSTSPFRPSPLARHIQDDDALEIYSELESEYAHNG